MLLERQVYNASTLVYFPFLFENEAGNINKPLFASEKLPFLNAQANEIPIEIDIQFSPLVLVLPTRSISEKFATCLLVNLQ